MSWNSNLDGEVWRFLKKTKKKKKFFSDEEIVSIPKNYSDEILLEVIMRINGKFKNTLPSYGTNYMMEILEACEKELSDRKLDTRTKKLKQLGI